MGSINKLFANFILRSQSNCFEKKVQIFSNHKYLIMILLFMGLHRINKSSLVLSLKFEQK
jgi:hypothetical protein